MKAILARLIWKLLPLIKTALIAFVETKIRNAIKTESISKTTGCKLESSSLSKVEGIFKQIESLKTQVLKNTDTNKTQKGKKKMKAEFYDVKAKEKVTALVTDKVKMGDGVKARYAFKAKTADGRSLTRFVTKKDYDAARI